MIPSHDYSPIPPSSGFSETENDSTARYQKPFPSFLVIAQFIAIGVVGTIAYFIGKASVDRKECGKRLSTWSPALDIVEYHQETFRGDFYAPSVYRGEPRPELDEAWDKVTKGGLKRIRIPKDDIYRLNKTASKNIVGFAGEDSEDIHDVEGLLEVFHQLHCLNELRKETWPGHYDRYNGNTTEDRHHLDHCVEMLRINIMCTADVTPITSNWVPWNAKPIPDFSTLHTCRNFESILEYVTVHSEDAKGIHDRPLMAE